MSLCMPNRLSEFIWSHLRSFGVISFTRRHNQLYYKNAMLLKNALSFFGQWVLQTQDTVRGVKKCQNLTFKVKHQLNCFHVFSTKNINLDFFFTVYLIWHSPNENSITRITIFIVRTVCIDVFIIYYHASMRFGHSSHAAAKGHTSATAAACTI